MLWTSSSRTLVPLGQVFKGDDGRRAAIGAHAYGGLLLVDTAGNGQCDGLVNMLTCSKCNEREGMGDFERVALRLAAPP